VSRPRVRPLAAALAVSLVLPVGLAAPSTATMSGPPTDDRALSTPAEDSYYPAKGDPTVDALHYDLDLTWRRAARVLRGVTTLRMRAARDDEAITLDLSGRLTVRQVRLDGAPVPFTHRGNHLVVRSPVEEDARHTVRVVYHGTPGPARGPASRSDIARIGMRVTDDGRLWTMQEPFGAFTWYAVNDHPSDKARYDVRVDVPGKWVGVSNGRLASRRTSKGRTVTRWTNRDPMPSYLLTLAVGPYRAYRQRGPRDLPITHWVPRDRPDLAKPLLRTPVALRWLERRLGRYPFDRAGTVVVPGMSAMETQTMVTFGAGNWHLGRFHVRSVMVHELAHHWWGNAVTPSDWRDLWMNEGMASYLHTRWEDEHSDRRTTSWRWAVRDWTDSDQWLRDLYGPPGAYDRGQFASGNVYWSVALMWERLRRRLGDETFDRLVRRWPQTRLHTSSSRAELVDWWSAHSGEDLEPFFDRWLDSPRSPA
jgi:aminopeptidase N